MSHPGLAATILLALIGALIGLLPMLVSISCGRQGLGKAAVAICATVCALTSPAVAAPTAAFLAIAIASRRRSDPAPPPAP